jgi:hypothetical protein
LIFWADEPEIFFDENRFDELLNFLSFLLRAPKLGDTAAALGFQGRLLLTKACGYLFAGQSTPISTEGSN